MLQKILVFVEFGTKSSKNQDVGKLKKRAFVRVITNSTEISRCNVAQN